MNERPEYLPEGLRSVTPYLIVPGVDRLIGFLREAFGGVEEGVHRRDDGSVQHARVRIGDSAVEMGEAGPEWPATPCSLHLYVPDADAVHARALAAGAELLYPPRDQPYGDREGGVRDPSGNQWFIATHRRS